MARTIQIGLGPLPIVFSTNLFLWFKDDWFYWQFVLIALGFAGKAFVKWNRDGKRVHIFNPSAFTLAIFSIVLLATGTTHLTWGQEIATTFSLGPRIYTLLFVVGLVVMYFFAITPVTAAAAVTLVGLSALYTSITGVPYFVDSDIPSAVFLGLHLLVTDPSTSPRTPLGRADLRRAVRRRRVRAVCAARRAGDADLLRQVVVRAAAEPRRAGDRSRREDASARAICCIASRSTVRSAAATSRTWRCGWPSSRFMTTTGAADGMHKGDSLPFWEQACAEGKPRACERLLRIEASYCGDNAGWACNELGRHHLEGRIVERDPERAIAYFSRACEGRFQAGCVNLLDASTISRSQSASARSAVAVARGRSQPARDARAGVVSARLPHGWSFACERAAN